MNEEDDLILPDDQMHFISTDEQEWKYDEILRSPDDHSVLHNEQRVASTEQGTQCDLIFAPALEKIIPEVSSTIVCQSASEADHEKASEETSRKMQ